MKITDITLQARNPNRVNVSVDGRYRFSLDIAQVTELGLKIGNDYTEGQLAGLEDESQFGKLYARALEYTLMRPHSAKEVRDYLWKKTRLSRVKVRGSAEVRERPGVSPAIADRVYDRLVKRGHIDDESFARYWVENRQLRKGISHRKLVAELRAKGVDTSVIDSVMHNSPREEKDEIKKVIEKKRARYDEEQKLVSYLLRQGFSYDAIRSALDESDQDF